MNDLNIYNFYIINIEIDMEGLKNKQKIIVLGKNVLYKIIHFYELQLQNYIYSFPKTRCLLFLIITIITFING